MTVKALAIDVDGVLIGQRNGFNSPLPHGRVLETLGNVHASGIPVILVTAKLHYSIHDIVKRAGLSGRHVADGGAILIDVLADDKIVSSIQPETAKKILQALVAERTYTCFYTPDAYYSPEGGNADIVAANTSILQKEPVAVQSLARASLGKKVTKIMPIVRGDDEKKKATALFESLKTGLVLHWAKNPMAPGLWFGFATAPGVSKLTGLSYITGEKDIGLENVLGVGDSDSDLVFMQACGFVAAMGNGTSTLKQQVRQWGRKGYVGPGVDENGILDILDHFLGS